MVGSRRDFVRSCIFAGNGRVVMRVNISIVRDLRPSASGMDCGSTADPVTATPPYQTLANRWGGKGGTR